MAGDQYDREKHHWWKAKKWAYFNLNRLFIRYIPLSVADINLIGLC